MLLLANPLYHAVNAQSPAIPIAPLAALRGTTG